MLVINERRIRDDKIAQLQKGCIAYAESMELIRLIKRSIKENNINVHYDYTNTGCWFVPLEEESS